MALTEQQRAEIYSSLADTIGQQGAEFLMAQQPPGGWEQLATKRDLADLGVKTQASFVELHAKMDVQFAQLREQIAEQFAEVKEQFAAVDTRFAAVDTRFAEVDTRFAEFSDKRSRDVWAFVAAITVLTVSICGSLFCDLAIRTSLNDTSGDCFDGTQRCSGGTGEPDSPTVLGLVR